MTSRHIVISDKEGALPYSKGLMASSILATGLAPARAFRVAALIEEVLIERGVESVTRAGLVELASATLAEEEGEEYAESYRNWQSAQHIDRPIIVLIGGATGVGKSTLATLLAARLGITRVIPTDAIREVMRGMLSKDLVPALHSSSFDADTVVRRPLPRPTSDPLLVGFREQVMTVAVGIRALARRAVTEGSHLIVEGVHAIPNVLDPQEFRESAVIVPVVVTVEDEEVHHSHFASRAARGGLRPLEHYAEHFGHIRKIQDYVVGLAEEHGIPVVTSYSLDATLSQVSDLVVGAATGAVRSQMVNTT